MSIPAQKPAIGRIVHAIVDPSTNNGSDVAPAVITRVWNDTMVNIKVLLDGPTDIWQTSLSLTAERPAAGRGAFWPPRVG